MKSEEMHSSMSWEVVSDRLDFYDKKRRSSTTNAHQSGHYRNMIIGR